MHLKTLGYVFLFAIYSTRGDNLLLSPRVLYIMFNIYHLKCSKRAILLPGLIWQMKLI